MSTSVSEIDSVQTLHNACQEANVRVMPKYESVSHNPRSHDAVWMSIVYVDEIEYGRGKGGSKKSSKQAAAKNALDSIRDEPRFASFFLA